MRKKINMKNATITLGLALILGGLVGCSSEKKPVDETNSKYITEENNNIEKNETNEDNGQARIYDAEGNVVDVTIN